MITIDELATFCKKKGFVYPSCDIYGGLSGFFDYGPLGVEVKNRIKQEWWRTFVQQRPDVVGIDGALVNHPRVWEASGHVAGFNDVLVECMKCKTRQRADHLVEERLKIKADGLHAEDLNKLIQENKIRCACTGELAPAAPFNLMFKTFVGPKMSDDTIAYLRPETAQLMFTNFKLITETCRVKLPFGIAQTGRAFRNEISPRDFLFRSREFEQMEIEFFTHPKQENHCSYFNEIKSFEINFLSAKEQEKKSDKHVKVMLDDMVKGKLCSQWQAYWLAQLIQWFVYLGVNSENLRVREHRKDELAHYASACFDIEYRFPFGWKEIHGNAARSNFDLSQHQKFSGKSLEVFDEGAKERFIPVVASEPSQGVDRAFLVFIYEAYSFDGERGNVVLRLHPKLVPVQIAVFPLLSNREELTKKAQAVYDELRFCYAAQYDTSGSIGRRYARADEIGVPLCITIDFDTLKDDTVTLRNRETTKQVRVGVAKLRQAIFEFLTGKKFEELPSL